VEFASPPGENNNHNKDAPLRFQRIDNIVEPESSIGFTPWTLVAKELHVVSSDEPTSFALAEGSPSWRKAMVEDMEFIEDNQTRSLADLPPRCGVIGLKWVFKVKRDEHGAVAKHKARLVVKGYLHSGMASNMMNCSLRWHDWIRCACSSPL